MTPRKSSALLPPKKGSFHSLAQDGGSFRLTQDWLIRTLRVDFRETILPALRSGLTNGSAGCTIPPGPSLARARIRTNEGTAPASPEYDHAIDDGRYKSDANQHVPQ